MQRSLKEVARFAEHAVLAVVAIGGGALLLAFLVRGATV